VWYCSREEPDEERAGARHRIERFAPDRVEDYVSAARLVQPGENSTAESIAARSQPGWFDYVAYDDEAAGGEPCAVGSLFVRSATAYLAWWYTHPDHRGRGLQQAGIRRRVRDAFDLGCDLAFTVTDFNFTSPANLQRCGFRLAYNYLLLRRDPTPLP
jgi:GNAT superfamily N-acetyltransferase